MNNGTVLLILTFCVLLDTLFGLIATPQKVLTKKKFSRAGKNGSVVYIDVENVRGKSGFKLTHENLIKSSQIWAKRYGLEGHVSLIVDHGRTANGYYLRDNNNETQSHLSIIFSGEGMKADDVIVRDVKFCHEQLLRDLIVVTADTELIKRCKREAAKARKTHVQGRSKKGKGRLKEEGRELEIIQPLSFLEDLEDVVKEEVTLMNNYNNKTLLVADIRSNNNNTEEAAAVELDEATSAMEEEISLQGKLIAIQTQLSSKSVKKISPNKRRKLQRSEMRLRTKLGQMQSKTKTKTKINDTTTSLSSTTDDDESTVLNNLLMKWKDIRKSSSRKELTGDRILLAEGLRRELEHITTPPSPPYVALDEEEEEEDFSLLLDGEYLRNKMNTPAEAHVCYVNTLIYKEQQQKRKAKANKKRQKEVVQSTRTVDFDKKDTIRLVIISDTHGLERSLTTNHFEPWRFTMKEKENSPYDDDNNLLLEKNGDDDSYKLPEGDILLHLGDFAVDKSLNARNRAIVAFDKWLSQFSYPVKIILRGNHDPKNAEFPISGATYVNEPKTINFGSKVVMACVPHGVVATSKSNKKKNNRYSSSSSSSSRSILPCTTCDILATHEPPRNILDKCLDGEFAGSSALRIAVDNMRGMKPKFWVCGHIHEGRGAVRTTFGTKNNNNNNNQQRETLVINAANANPGRAEQIVYGPVVVDISSNTDNDDDGVMINYDDTPAPKEYNNNLQTEMKKRENVKDGEKELLLAIDLGLNCGASMFDDSGRLLRYEQLRFQNEEDLYQGAPELIESWVQDVNDVLNKEEQCCSLSYLVIEGGGHYLDAWEESLNNNNNENDDVQLICIRPEEWRSYLLTDKEKESSRACKEAARLIARQIVFEHSSKKKKKHEGKFKTDCAESVSIGYYMASRLGWVKKDPLVNRYSNGKVIVPR